MLGHKKQTSQVLYYKPFQNKTPCKNTTVPVGRRTTERRIFHSFYIIESLLQAPKYIYIDTQGGYPTVGNIGVLLIYLTTQQVILHLK